MAPLLINLSRREEANFEMDDDSAISSIVQQENVGCFRAILLRDCYLVDLGDKNIKKILDYKFDEDLNDDEFISEKAYISSMKFYTLFAETSSKKSYTSEFII